MQRVIRYRLDGTAYRIVLNARIPLLDGEVLTGEEGPEEIFSLPERPPKIYVPERCLELCQQGADLRQAVETDSALSPLLWDSFGGSLLYGTLVIYYALAPDRIALPDLFPEDFVHLMLLTKNTPASFRLKVVDGIFSAMNLYPVLSLVNPGVRLLRSDSAGAF